MTFQEYLDQTDFIKLYNKKILPRKGGGRDNVSPETYKPSFEKEIAWIRAKLEDGTYRFSPYREKLVLKGKNKYPRVLALPSVRDRFVLCLLNEYLSVQLGIKHMIPNLYITRVTEFIKNTRATGKDIFFFKTDISAFFDNINHSVLFNTLVDKIDGTAMKLVVRAVTTPTISSPADYHNINNKGVPQGLAISNILAASYVVGFHKDLENQFNDSLFLRYVDDVIILSTERKDFQSIVMGCIQKFNLGLELTESKTADGRIEDGFDFLGYKVTNNLISVKKKNKDSFSNRLAQKCILLKKQFENPIFRPRFASNDKDFLDYAETDLNLMISGFKAGNHNYGWISYFQRITDLTLLHQLDKLVIKCIGTGLGEKIKINSIVDTYFGLRENGGSNVLVDFDLITERGKRIAYLRRFGYVKSHDTKDLSEEEVEILFIRMINIFQKHSEQDIAETS